MGKSEESGQRVNDLTILTCVCRLAPIASQGSALPSVFGGSLQLRKKEIIVFIIYNYAFSVILCRILC